MVETRSILSLAKLSLLSLALCLVSCGEIDDGSSAFPVQLQSKKAFFINGTTKSCKTAEIAELDSTLTYPDDLQPFYFRIRGVKLPAAPAGFNYRVFSIKMTLTGTGLSGGKKDCTPISGDELSAAVKLPALSGAVNSATVSNSWRSVIGNVILGEDDPAMGVGGTVTLDCPLTCGSVAIAEGFQNEPFVVQGTLEVVGSKFPVTDPLSETPFRSTSTFEVENF